MGGGRGAVADLRGEGVADGGQDPVNLLLNLSQMLS